MIRNNKITISKIAIISIILAVIRCISEPFRLQYYSEFDLVFREIKPYLIGALLASIGLFGMIICFNFQFHKIVISIGILIVIILLLIKWMYIL